MPQPYCALLLPFLLVLSGCSSTTKSATPATAEPSTTQAPTGLANALSLFASGTGREWAAYYDLKDISWAGQPKQYSASKFEMSGRLLLAGFGTRRLPNGKIGSEYAEVDGNEGQAGVTLNGTKDIVQEFSVKKFYFSENYQEILQKQLPAGSKITKIADHCRQPKDAELDGRNSFFEVMGFSRQAIYVEAWLEDGGKYSPGYTVFDFARDLPIERIRLLKCMAV